MARDTFAASNQTKMESKMGPEKPDWQRLCEAAANEENPEKLTELMTKISRDIKEKEDRLRQQFQSRR